MRRALGFSVLLLGVGSAFFWVGGAPRPDLERVRAAFRIREVSVQGIQFLREEEVLRSADLPRDLEIWDSPAPIAARLREHPLVLDAQVRRVFPFTLEIRVQERVPVAYHPRPTLAPVDREGRALPLDPMVHSLDLPLLQAVAEGRSLGGGGGRQSDLDGLSPAQVRVLAEEVARLSEFDPDVLATLSEAALDRWGDVILRFHDPDVEFWYRPPLTPSRLREGVLAWADARGRLLDPPPEVVDLRFEDQVVVRFHSPRVR
jgi:hypothetical protein